MATNVRENSSERIDISPLATIFPLNMLRIFMLDFVNIAKFSKNDINVLEQCDIREILLCIYFHDNFYNNINESYAQVKTNWF